MNTESELLSTALEAAEAASHVHRRRFGHFRSETSTRKGPSDFVSEVDLESQKAALEVIRSRFPDHRIMAEEDDGEPGIPDLPPGDRTPLWIVDPLDGTTNFLHGHPSHAASVGVTIGGEGVAGVVIESPTGNRWWALRGQGAYRNDEPIRTSPVRDLEHALVGTGFPFRRPEELPMYLEEFERVFAACTGIRRMGSAALDLCYLAQGSLDAFWEGRLAPWDLAAGRTILLEAGGVLTHKDGSSVPVDAAGSVLAANSPELHRALFEVLNPDGTGATERPPPGNSRRGPPASSN